MKSELLFPRGAASTACRALVRRSLCHFAHTLRARVRLLFCVRRSRHCAVSHGVHPAAATWASRGGAAPPGAPEKVARSPGSISPACATCCSSNGSSVSAFRCRAWLSWWLSWWTARRSRSGAARPRAASAPRAAGPRAPGAATGAVPTARGPGVCGLVAAGVCAQQEQSWPSEGAQRYFTHALGGAAPIVTHPLCRTGRAAHRTRSRARPRGRWSSSRPWTRRGSAAWPYRWRSATACWGAA